MASMPHLSQLQRDLRDQNVTIIGLTSEDKNNSLEQVKQMVREKGDGMDFTVAWDVERTTNEAYMKASNQRGIPTSFLVDQAGKIAWIGHPLSVDIPMAMVLDKTWDYEKGPALLKRINDQKQALYEAAGSDPEKALELLAAFREAYPLAAGGLETLHFSILTQLPGREVEATKIGREIVEREIAAKNAGALNAFAWGLVDPEVSSANRFLDLALLAAVKANEFTGGEDPAILDTVARVYFWRGDLEKAVEHQKRAVKYADKRMKGSLTPALKEYEKAIQEKQPS